MVGEVLNWCARYPPGEAERVGALGSRRPPPAPVLGGSGTAWHPSSARRGQRTGPRAPRGRLSSRGDTQAQTFLLLTLFLGKTVTMFN